MFFESYTVWKLHCYLPFSQTNRKHKYALNIAEYYRYLKRKKGNVTLAEKRVEKLKTISRSSSEVDPHQARSQPVFFW